MTMIKLRNGCEEAESIVNVTMDSLEHLFHEGMGGMLALDDLNEMCKGKDYKPFGENLKKLQDLSLLQPDGKPHASVRNVVLSAVHGEGLGMHLKSPAADSHQAESVSKNTAGLDDLIAKILEAGKGGTPGKGHGGR